MKPVVGTPVVGILGYQGCIEPHEAILSQLGAQSLRVRTPEDLARIDRLILPGGESTTMLRFIKRYGMQAHLQRFALTHPVWGICAGAILAAREVSNPSQESLALIDISAHRNFYGSQIDSFTAALAVEGHARPIEAQFIRDPLLTPLSPSPGRPEIQIKSVLAGQPVFIAQGNVWACSFHVELGRNTDLHEHFLSLEVKAPGFQNTAGT